MGPGPRMGPIANFNLVTGSVTLALMLIPIDSSVFFAEVTFTFYLKSKNKGQYFVLCNGVTFWGVTFTL